MERSIYGIDFTSVPSLQHPITCAAGWRHANLLTIEQIIPLNSLSEFATFLERPAPWVAGFDLPFGQPKELVDWLYTNHGWPAAWPAFVRHMETQPRTRFRELLAEFRSTRTGVPKNAKRAVDAHAGSISAMMMAYVPVGAMFFVGAPLLLRSGASIIPCYPNTSGRVALEVYPAIVARKVLGHQSYKNDRQPIDRQPARAQILAELANPNGPIATAYGVTVALSLHDQAICLADPRGDYLDAVLAAIQAAWASTQPDYGVPSGHEHEGWIADPFLP